MNTKITAQILVFALAILVTLIIGSSSAFGQSAISQQSTESLTKGQDKDLVGVWEAVTPLEVDCQTGEPLPDTPTIRVMYTFNVGGTMSESNTDPNDGPYRSPGQGVWRQVSGRRFIAAYQHYSFAPDKTFTYLIKVRTTITLNRLHDSFRESGTFDVLLPDGTIVYQGCFADTANHLGF